MKKFKKISALVLALVMMLSMSNMVFAAEDGGSESGGGSASNVPTINNGETVSITSNFIFAEGLTVPGDNGVTFKYTATSETPDAATATISDVTFTETDRTSATAENRLYTLSKTQNITFGTWEHAGVYEYTVQQTEDSITNVTPGQEKYKMRVWVENKADGGLEIKNVTAEKLGEDGAEGEKQNAMTFDNTYRKTGSLTITKTTVSGTGSADLADKTKMFDFTINFNAAPTDADTTTTITGTIKDKDGKYLGLNGKVLDDQENKDLTFAVGDNGTTFKLKNGDTLEFASVPVGMQFKVTETGAADGYTPSIKVVSNGTEATYNSFAEAADATFDDALVGENENKAEFTNTYKDIPLTGIVTNNLPFILLIVVAVCGLGALAVMKKRRMVK